MATTTIFGKEPWVETDFEARAKARQATLGQFDAAMAERLYRLQLHDFARDCIEAQQELVHAEALKVYEEEFERNLDQRNREYYHKREALEGERRARQAREAANDPKI